MDGRPGAATRAAPRPALGLAAGTRGWVCSPQHAGRAAGRDRSRVSSSSSGVQGKPQTINSKSSSPAPPARLSAAASGAKGRGEHTRFFSVNLRSAAVAPALSRTHIPAHPEAALGAVVLMGQTQDTNPPARCKTPSGSARRGHVCPHCSAVQPRPLSRHKPGCRIRSQPPAAVGLSTASPRHRAAYLRRQGEQGCPAYRPSPDYQQLISLLGDKRH